MSEKRELTRAETVRMRRKQQSQKRLTQSSVLATRPLPPVTSRESQGYAMPKRSANPNVNRRYQASISLAGVHVQMPAISMPRTDFGWRWLSLFLSLAFSVAIYLMWTLPEFRVSAATVNGNQRLSAEEINAVLNVAGQPVFNMTPLDLETRLRLNYPELASANIAVTLPNALTVNVTERKPIIVWQQNGGYTWIDADGVAFRPRGAAENLISVAAIAAPAPGLPSANDPLSPVPFLSQDMVEAIQTLAPSVPAGTPMIYDPAYGLGWNDDRGWQVFFGTDAKDMVLKLQVYQAMVASLTQHGIYPTFISVQYVNAPYYRMSR